MSTNEPIHSAPNSDPLDSTVPSESNGSRPTPVASAEERLAELETRHAEVADAYLRAKADAENTRRRAEEEMSKARKFAVEAFAESLLPVRDSLEAAIALQNSSTPATPASIVVVCFIVMGLATVPRIVFTVISPGRKRMEFVSTKPPRAASACHAIPNSVVVAGEPVRAARRSYLGGRRETRHQYRHTTFLVFRAGEEVGTLQR